MKDKFENNDVQYQERSDTLTDREILEVALSVDEVANTWALNFAASEYLDTCKTIGDLYVQKEQIKKIMQFQKETFPQDERQLTIDQTIQMQKCAENHQNVSKRYQEAVNYLNLLKKNYSEPLTQAKQIGQREIERRARERYQKNREEEIAKRKTERAAQNATKTENAHQQNAHKSSTEQNVASATPQKKTASNSTTEKKGFTMKQLSKIAIIAVVVMCIIVSAIAYNVVNTKHTITFYNNKGIYFYITRQGEERMEVLHQNNEVYEVVTFSGKYPSEPTPPKYKGYVFMGWYQDPECTEKFMFGHYEVNSDINLYAKWVQT